MTETLSNAHRPVMRYIKRLPLFALLVTFVIMLVAGRASSKRQPGLMHDVTTRFMGLIVLAMGVQFALTGLVEFLRN